jgi:hypothetical protein
MAGTIWLIVEGQNDGDIVKAILKCQYPQARVSPLYPTSQAPNLSRLAAQIKKLIQQAIANRKPGDCIAVLHDADQLTRPTDRSDYERIEQVCKQYSQDVRLILAKDEIESWLLGDTGFCQWLQIKAQNCDELKQPSLQLASLLDRAEKPKYRLNNLSKLLRYLNGNSYSPSLQAALRYLENAPCIKIKTE